MSHLAGMNQMKQSKQAKSSHIQHKNFISRLQHSKALNKQAKRGDRKNIRIKELKLQSRRRKLAFLRHVCRSPSSVINSSRQITAFEALPGSRQ